MREYHVEDQRFPIVKQCESCGNREGNFCRIYRVPGAKWTGRPCPMATFLKKAVEQKEKELDPLKASKRKARGK